jgi:hypothetical protein
MALPEHTESIIDFNALNWGNVVLGAKEHKAVRILAQKVTAAG